MPTLNHPRIPNVTVDAPDSDVDQWVAVGWVAYGTPADDDRPAGNASREDWEAYALDQGADAESIEDLTRDELRDLYT